MNIEKIKKLKRKFKKPKFLRQEWFKFKRLGEKWRAPKGNQSKLRRGFKARGHIPTVGYGKPKEIRGIHPCGLKPILIENLNQLKNVNKEKEAVIIKSSVGKKKRLEIIKTAESLGIKILNKNIQVGEQ
ncbi:MAG: 50S ribosomal protein L32e [Candidatus Aenigmatarchaeota archaeon]|nr:50S ribosomal protein L32e [Candidatus Aenigmarchaeota archaeon]